VLVVVLDACRPASDGSDTSVGEGPSSTGTETTQTATGTSGSGGDTEDTGAAACPADALLVPGDHELTLEHDGVMRELKLHIPPGHDGTQRIPLLFNLHPWTFDANYQIAASAMRSKADAEGFVVVHPQGIGKSWNGGPVCCSPANQDGVDDVGFVRAMIEMLTDTACIDTTRVYATGYSNGGYLSYRLACEASDVIAAIGPVSAALGIEPENCTPQRAVPTLAIHGTEDTLIDYAFAKAGADVLADRNGCGAQTERSFEQGSAYCDARTECAEGGAQVFCTVDGGGHCWFGQAVCAFGTNTMDIIATDTVWAFVSQHSLP
jgi:polyhydroxybutyrate depolymerase